MSRCIVCTLEGVLYTFPVFGISGVAFANLRVCDFQTMGQQFIRELGDGLVLNRL